MHTLLYLLIYLKYTNHCVVRRYSADRWLETGEILPVDHARVVLWEQGYSAEDPTRSEQFKCVDWDTARNDVRCYEIDNGSDTD